MARIPFRVPPVTELPTRIDAVLSVVHVLYSTGHTAPAGADLIRRDLVERSLDLARVLRTLLPDNADVAGLLALVLLTDARRPSRLGDDGRLVLLPDQDRTRWDRTAIGEGVALVHQALARRPPGRFALMAAIAAVHAQAPSWESTDWTEIVGIYDLLVEMWPSPVVALNRAVAVGLAQGPGAGLVALDALGDEPLLATYSYFASARADFLRQLGRNTDARMAYEERERSRAGIPAGPSWSTGALSGRGRLGFGNGLGLRREPVDDLDVGESAEQAPRDQDFGATHAGSEHDDLGLGDAAVDENGPVVG
jgi:RNA polymerase sigma-70 factor (ECF subfamily)